MSKRKNRIAKRKQLSNEILKNPDYFRKSSVHSSEKKNKNVNPEYTHHSNFFWIKVPDDDNSWYWDNRFFPKDTDSKILKKAIKENNEYFNELIEKRKARKNL